MMAHYFSNGTEGDAWTAVWCDTCVHDHDTHPGDHPRGLDGSFGCPLLLAALAGETVPEWTQRDGAPFVLPPDVVCAQYEPCTADGCLGDPQPAARAGARARVAEALG